MSRSYFRIVPLTDVGMHCSSRSWLKFILFILRPAWRNEKWLHYFCHLLFQPWNSFVLISIWNKSLDKFFFPFFCFVSHLKLNCVCEIFCTFHYRHVNISKSKCHSRWRFIYKNYVIRGDVIAVKSKGCGIIRDVTNQTYNSTTDDIRQWPSVSYGGIFYCMYNKPIVCVVFGTLTLPSWCCPNYSN